MIRLVENKLNNVTVLITSCYQREITIETANYYSELCNEIVLVDEQQPHLPAADISALSKRGIIYVPYKNLGHANPILHKRMIAASRSNNKYVVHSNHDERYTYLGLRACIAELEKDNSPTFCIGQAIAIRKNESGIHFTRSYKNLSVYKNINKINQRLYYHAKKYAPLAHYSVWRKQSYIDTTKKVIRIHEMIPSSTMFEEVIFELAADLTGNSVAIPELFWIRNRVNAPGQGKLTKDKKAFKTIGKKLKILFESFEDVQLSIIMNSLRKHFKFVMASTLRRKINSLIKRSLFFLKERKRLSDSIKVWHDIDAFLHQNNIIYDKGDISNVLKSMNYKDNSQKLVKK